MNVSHRAEKKTKKTVSSEDGYQKFKLKLQHMTVLLSVWNHNPFDGRKPFMKVLHRAQLSIDSKKRTGFLDMRLYQNDDL